MSNSDFRYALRGLRRNRAFTAAAIITLGLGIGAITAIFSVVNAVLLRPLPYADADRLVLIWKDLRARGATDFLWAPPSYRDLRDGNTVFENVAALTPSKESLTVPGEAPERVKYMGVTPSLLAVLGARVALGRPFADDDARPAPTQAGDSAATSPPTMILLNHAFWQRRFGGDAGVVGKSVQIGGEQAIVIGVLAPGFEILFPPNTNVEPNPDILGADRIDYDAAPINVAYLRVIGKLRPTVGLTAARASVERLAQTEWEKNPIMKAANAHYRLEPMQQDLVADVRPAIVALMGAVTFVLLIACANVANLLLVRAAAREREVAIRATLGGSSLRIVRQLLTEALLLALGGAILGIALGAGAIDLLVALSPSNLPRLGHVSLDPVVLLFAIGVSLAAAVVFGLVPALRAARPDLATVLRASGRTPGLGGGKLLRNSVVVAEVMLAFVLLVGGGLMVRSFIELSRIDPGFDPSGVLTVGVGSRPGANEDERAAFVRQLRERFEAVPGVDGVTSVAALPLTGRTLGARWGTAEAVADPTKFQNANVHAVLPGYFAVMRTRVLAGRVFTDADNVSDRLVVVIDDRLAQKAFPGTSAIGERLYVRTQRGPKEDWVEVIGVVQHQRHDGLAAPGRDALFFTDAFYHHGVVSTWAIRLRCTAASPCAPAALAPDVRRVVAEVDSRVPVAEVQTFQAVVDRAMTGTRFSLILVDVFAGVAVLLACIGLYGVLATAVRQRTAEIGVRMALGATRGRIVSLVIRDGLMLIGTGLVLGLFVAVWLTRAMATMLVGIRPTDPATYATMMALFIVIAVIACWIPARRAAAIDPAAALRP